MTRRRLTLLILLFFIALAIPTSILVYQAYGRLKLEAFYQLQRLAHELSLRIDSGFRDFIDQEENRPISDYEFLNVAGSAESAFLQRSPLSQHPLQIATPGILGYFQVDAAGRLHTPMVPDGDAGTYGIASSELKERTQRESQIRNILNQNRLVGKSDAVQLAPAAEMPAGSESVASAISPNISAERQLGASQTYRLDESASAEPTDLDHSGQSVFDRLLSRKQNTPAISVAPEGKVKDLKLENRYAEVKKNESEVPLQDQRKQVVAKRARKETVNLPQSQSRQLDSLEEKVSQVADDKLDAAAPVLNQQATRIQTFESEVEPMEFALLDSGHFVLFRRIWHRNQRYVQGILIEQSRFLEQMIELAFRESSLSSMSKLIVAYQGGILQNYALAYNRKYRPSADQASNELLYQSRLVAPFGDVELIYTLARLPVGVGGQVIIWSALVIAIVLIGGCLMLLRLGLRQLSLARQQQDFVSAVSHELKTPLTSIRMYGEMLRAGWVDEEKRRSYYDFIFHEAERLTRLINNVLHLARMSRNEHAATLKVMTVAETMAELKPRLISQLEPSGFELVIDGDAAADSAGIEVDIDWFIQIFINLVDNAIKFSASEGTRQVDIRYRKTQDGHIQFSVRDYGRGIAPDQMKKIFRLFYRSENELTRDTAGTGIGLALVQQLATAMNAEVDVVNCDPGAEFRIQFATRSPV